MRMRPLRALLLGTFVFLGLGSLHHAAWSQLPKTIKVLISVPPGGSIDLLVRVLADHIGKTHGQTIIVESRPGAGSIIAAEAGARAAPDGGTLLINSNGMMISSKIRKVNFDPLTSYEPICNLVNSPLVIVVNSDSSYRTFGDFLDAARAKPGALSLGSVGPLTTQHIAIEQLKRLAKVDLTYVPFTGGAPAINALLGGHITAVLQNYSEAGEQLNAGKLRALATPSTKRIEPLPNLPTVAESGYPDFAAEVWFGLVAPAKTPQDTMAQLIDMFGEALRAPEVKEKLVVQALYPNATCGADFAAHLQHQSDEYARVIRELNLKG
jgi:tripartite-type tricarboxylate transporter receptor subunit TctC